MSETLPKRHVLEPFLAEVRNSTPEACGVSMEVLPFRGYLNLRGDPTVDGFAESVGNALGQPLPLAVNTVSEGDCRAFWLGPDEWLIVTEPGREATLKKRLDTALAGRIFALTDLTGGQVCIRLGGHRAREALAKGCTLDLQRRVFHPGQCAQTVLGKAPVLIALLRDGPDSTVAVDAPVRRGTGTGEFDVFETIVRRSFAEYAANWLYQSGQEYGVRVDCKD